MQFKEYIIRGRERCPGCQIRGICPIKAIEMKHICPCLECPVLVMCKKGCDQYENACKISNAILNSKFKKL